MKEKKQEELQSRREFFKSAAKAALPVVGAVILSSLPIAKTEAATRCNDGCSYSCNTSCAVECRGYCHYGCKNTCTGTCSGSSKK